MRLISIVLMSTIAISMWFSQSARARAGFSDISRSTAYAGSIEALRRAGILQGYPDGTFRPDALINRAEFAKILEESIPDAPNGIGLCPPDPQDYRRFSDVRGDDWFWIYVCMQDERGIVTGYPDGTFRPANPINFAEAAKMLYGAYHLDDRGLLLSFTSAESPWFRPFVVFLAEQFAIPPSVTRFDQRITRGEMAEMIERLRMKHTQSPSTPLDAIE